MTEEFISIQGNGEYIITDTTHTQTLSLHTVLSLFFLSFSFLFFWVVHSVSTMSTIADINQSMKSPASSEHNTINEGILYIELLFVFLFSVGHHENLRKKNPRRDPKPLLDYLFDDSSSLYWIIYRYVYTKYTKYTCGCIFSYRHTHRETDGRTDGWASLI